MCAWVRYSLRREDDVNFTYGLRCRVPAKTSHVGTPSYLTRASRFLPARTRTARHGPRPPRTPAPGSANT